MDDLVDLDWSASGQPASGQPAAGKPRGAAQGDTAQRAPSSYDFESLLRSMPSASSPKPPATRPAPRPAPPSARPAGAQSAASSGGDAFSSLLPTSWSGAAAPPANATLAEQQRRQQSANGQAAGGAQRPAAGQAPAHPPVHDFWGLDAFEEAPKRAGGTDGSLDNKGGLQPSHSDDDLLGALGGPAPSAPAPAAKAPATDTSGAAPKATATGASGAAPNVASGRSAPPGRSEPPPHVVGRLVEMGFPPLAAREALAQTPSGADVQAAAQILLAGAGREEPPPQDEEPEQRDDDAGWGDDLPRLRAAAAARRATYQDDEQRPSERRPHERQAPPAGDWHKQADALFQQANTLGNNMLNRASAFWASSREKAQRALEESRGADGQGPVDFAKFGREAMRRWGAGGKRQPEEWQGKPRWMLDAEAGTADDSQRAAAAAAARREPAQRPAATAAEQRLAQRPAAKAAEQRPAALASERPAAQPAPRPAAAPSRPAQRPAAQPQATPRKLVRAAQPAEDPSVVSRATSLKTQGNEAFLRGAYGEAEELYTRALAALDAASLRRVPLLNNRANVRLKNGRSSDAAADCSAVLALIVPPDLRVAGPPGTQPLYRPSLVDDRLPPPLAEAVNLRDAFAKALSQRARANEADERWREAAGDWALLLAFERDEGSGVKSGAQHRRAAQEGAARCDKMLHPAPKAPAAKPAAPTPRSAASRAAAQASAAGVARVRAQREAQDEEEGERMRLKDSVDQRIAAWTAGKQGNVRALLASIDDPGMNLVWPELRWKKVGMHELVTDAQVKRNYTRAIARLHPDKLSPGSTTVEQRMLASGMFNALNEAYTA